MSVIAFASFWTTGRPELDDEVAYWMGQSPEQIEIFTNEEDITKSKSTRLIAYCDSRLKAFNSWEQQKSHPHLFQKATNGENERFLGRDPEFLSDSREISGERLCEP